MNKQSNLSTFVIVHPNLATVVALLIIALELPCPFGQGKRAIGSTPAENFAIEDLQQRLGKFAQRHVL